MYRPESILNVPNCGQADFRHKKTCPSLDVLPHPEVGRLSLGENRDEDKAVMSVVSTAGLRSVSVRPQHYVESSCEICH